MIKKKVVEFVRAHEVFGALGNRVGIIIARHEFRRNRCIDDINQNSRDFFIFLAFCKPLHQMLHKSLRHRCIDGIHRHMVAIICTPAESQFGEVASAEHYTAATVGIVHKNLRAFAGLRVLKSRVMAMRVLSDIVEMLSHSRSYWDFERRDSQKFHEMPGIVAGFGCSGKTGHSDCFYPVARHPHYVECAACHK